MEIGVCEGYGFYDVDEEVVEDEVSEGTAAEGV